MENENLLRTGRSAQPGKRGRSRLRANRRGSVTLLVAASLPPLLLAGIFAIDEARIRVAEARLQSAADAAALTAARDINRLNSSDANEKKAAQDNIDAVLAANYNGGAPSSPSGGAKPKTWQDVRVTQPNPGQVRVQASVTVTPLLSGLGISGTSVWPKGPTTVTRVATANRTGTGIELALVFDVTLSMQQSDGTVLPDGSRPSRIAAARDAALRLTSVLYGGAATKNRGGENVTTQESLYISVVPYNVAVNIGSEYTGWLSSAGAPTYPSGHSWAGCVEARGNGFDVREDSPNSANPNTLFRRYYWASTYDSAQTSSGKHCTNAQDYDSNLACQGHNDWTAPADLQRKNHLVQLLGSRGASFGPNFMCPTLPVLPLTMRRETVDAHINSLVGTAERPYPFSFGTALPAGLQAAWYTLSPSWQGMWRNHDHSSTVRPALPMAYGTEKMVKVMVLLSDGDNNWLSARSVLPAASLVRPENQRTELFYNTYGDLASNRLRIAVPGGEDEGTRSEAALASHYRTVQPRADAALDAMTRQTCAAIKQAGITIYTVGLGVAETAHRRLLEDCASTPTQEDVKKGITSYYIHTNNAGDLSGAFTHIANQLTNLRLVQ
jgi:Flp pilus assembly protein TadG